MFYPKMLSKNLIAVFVVLLAAVGNAAPAVSMGKLVKATDANANPDCLEIQPGILCCFGKYCTPVDK
ncbi:hypothetical protein BGZ58_010310 [Dissophora ornata]|nr:hypothetical protein BGZ58_010310 [Dissophora ornata]